MSTSVQQYTNNPRPGTLGRLESLAWEQDLEPLATRLGRVFDLVADAHAANAEKGGKGLIVERPGKAKRCAYCEARTNCTQAEQLQLQGLLD